MPSTSILARASRELGITTLLSSPRSAKLLLLTRLLRMYAYGSSTLILALFFSALGHSDAQIGLFMTLTLVGDVLISLVLTLFADRLGRRRILILGSLLMSFSGIIFATFSNFWILLFAAVMGVISPSGNEIGPFRAVEESTLAQLSDPKTRSDIFALYVVAGTLGTAMGSLSAGWGVQELQSSWGWSEVGSFRVVFWVYAGIGLVKAVISLLLSADCEVTPEPKESRRREGGGGEEQEAFLATNTEPSKPKTTRWFNLSAKSQLTLAKLCGLFFFDSLASGMVPGSLIAFYISRKFDVTEGYLGTVMAAAQFVSSLGNMFASSVAKRIGLVRTMVFTHLPSAIFLALLPVPTSLFMTIVLLVARSSLASMDQAPRSAFLSAVVLPSERTAVMGIVNTVKTMSQSSGPLITGLLAADSRFWVAFVVAGGLKASYDLAMLSMFASTPLEGDREEARRQARSAEAEAQFELGSDDDENEATQDGDRDAAHQQHFTRQNSS